MHLFPADRVVGSVGFVEAAVELAERGARRVFETGCEDPVWHLVVPAGGAAAHASLEWPWSLLDVERPDFTGRTRRALPGKWPDAQSSTARRAA